MVLRPTTSCWKASESDSLGDSGNEIINILFLDAGVACVPNGENLTSTVEDRAMKQ